MLNKRARSITVTIPPKNGAGGDRPPRSDQQRQHSSRAGQCLNTTNTQDTEEEDPAQTSRSATAPATPVTPLDRWLTWFGKHSVLWLDTLIRCSGIHNYLSSSIPFSPFEKLFLANGLRFICTPPSTQLSIFKSHYFDDEARGWLRFQRSLLYRLKYGHDSDDGYLAKFAVKSTRNIEHTLTHLREQLVQENTQGLAMLDRYCRATLELLTSSASLEHHRKLVRHQRINHSPRDLAFIRRLMTDASITIKPADKNLGMCLVDSDWYHRELHRMLTDRVTYKPFNFIDHTGRPCSLKQLQERIYTELRKIASKGQRTLEAWHPQLAEQAIKYLNQTVTASSCTVPDIYLLIKVHKAAGLSGRPIVPSTHWLTTPASVIVDHLLQEVMRGAHISHIVKDTKSLINELEHTTLPTLNGIFVTADIATLYTNIDTELGLRLVRKFLVEQQVLSARIDLIMSLLAFVMENSYLRFRDQIYHQIDGTAMGTACAPTYANIVVYMLEKDVIAELADRVHLYRRFLDDVFTYLDADVAEEFMLRMNGLHPKLRFEFVSHPNEASFLDLRIHKGPRFTGNAIFDLSVHQKKMNLYLYIPFRSFHTDAMKRSFIQTELMRYIRNSSDAAEYMQLKHIFYQRLRDRGYPSSFLLPIFNTIFYSDRHLFLWPSATLHEHPLIHTARSLCLQKRIQRWKQSRCPAGTETSSPLVFVIPYSPLSRVLSTRRILSRQWGQVRDALGEPSLPQPIIAYQSAPSLAKTLVFQRARKLEEARKASIAPTAVPKRQLTIESFFRA